MSVNRYSMAKDGRTRLTPHFLIAEFACRDGSDEILLDPDLPLLLEDIRARCGHRPVTVNSGYRTPDYNRKIGGATESFHMKGLAADIAVSGAAPAETAAAAELSLFAAGYTGGVGLYETFVHVDLRGGFWRQNMVTGQMVSGFGPAARPTLRRGAAAHAETLLLQERLNGFGAALAKDGAFGPKTEEAVRAFQSRRGLISDGVVGRQTWCALFAY